MKSKEKDKLTAGGGSSGGLRIFSSFSRGKAASGGGGLLLGGDELSSRSHSDPVLLRVRRRTEEPGPTAHTVIR